MKNILGIRYSQWKMIFWLTTNLIFYKENLLSKTKMIVCISYAIHLKSNQEQCFSEYIHFLGGGKSMFCSLCYTVLHKRGHTNTIVCYISI